MDLLYRTQAGGESACYACLDYLIGGVNYEQFLLLAADFITLAAGGIVGEGEGAMDEEQLLEDLGDLELKDKG